MKPLALKDRIKMGFIGAMVGRSNPDYSTKCFEAAFFGQWEGGDQSRFRDRPGRRTAGQDVDLNYGVREDLLSEARSLHQTEPVVKRVVDQYATYCVGKCNARWNLGEKDSDIAIAEIYRANWMAWMKVCDYRGLHRFSKLMKMAVGTGMVTDGDSFCQKVLTPDRRAMLNMIEADRVSSAGIYNADTESMVGGIGLDPKTRRHLFIRVWNRTIYGTFVNPMEIPAADFLHLFDSSRVDAARGVTAFHAVLNQTRDKKEIAKAETAKVKRHSKLALIVKLITGRAPFSFGEENASNDGPGHVMRQRVDDATDAYTFPNEDMKPHEYNGPSSAWIGHMDFVIRNIALGVNLPFGVVWNMAGLGKPGVLFELEQAARTFSATQDELESRYILPIIGWATSVDIAAKRIPFHPKWYEYKVGRPAYISIDAGRDSKSGIAENLMAMKSATRWYDESGDDFEDQTELCYKEAAFHKKMSVKYGIPVETVRQTTPNGNPNSAGDADKLSQED